QKDSIKFKSQKEIQNEKILMLKKNFEIKYEVINSKYQSYVKNEKIKFLQKKESKKIKSIQKPITSKEKENFSSEKTKSLFLKNPVWKSILIMSIPAMIMMLAFGMYTFVDNILAINYADDSYKTLTIGTTSWSGKDQVRFIMGSVGPITTFQFSVVMLFGVGVGARYSINLGAGNIEKAEKTAKSGMISGLIVSVLLIPVLVFASKAWIGSQFEGSEQMKDFIEENTYKYVFVIIFALPFMMYNQITSSLMRSEGRNFEILLTVIIPLFINLGLDVVFMSSANMGVEGGAWATFISYFITSFMLTIFIFLKQEMSTLTFRMLFNPRGFAFVFVIAIVIVGVAPFLRNMAQSITQTIEMQQIGKVSKAIYGDENFSRSVLMSVFPIFGLAFPIMFGFIQGGSPVLAFNYGAKKMNRVKQSSIIISIFSSITGILILFIFAYFLYNPLVDLLGVKNINGIDIKGKGQMALKIMMISCPLFGLAMGGMTLFNSSDRVSFNLFANSLRGIILMFPFLFGFSALSQSHGAPNGDIAYWLTHTGGFFSDEMIFWWFYPSLAGTATLIILLMMFLTMSRIDKNNETLDSRINRFEKRVYRKLSFLKTFGIGRKQYRPDVELLRIQKSQKKSIESIKFEEKRKIKMKFI
ncbi:MAG: polysaccharide biosynthesis C-terminal domain-containing protein, partial [Mollicutes bacterium PWAP]|nr:polysaccharide biosynthesis C-terminal domain-containing protein [Mollicutes bacterium PWAP]